jgi:hypothetical protein
MWYECIIIMVAILLEISSKCTTENVKKVAFQTFFSLSIWSCSRNKINKPLGRKYKILNHCNCTNFQKENKQKMVVQVIDQRIALPKIRKTIFWEIKN